MSWVTRMNDTIDYVSLFQTNAEQLRAYLADSWPISQERLVARQQYEELLKNMVRRAKAVGCDPDMIEPDFASLLSHFVQQNVDTDASMSRSRPSISANSVTRAWLAGIAARSASL